MQLTLDTHKIQEDSAILLALSPTHLIILTQTKFKTGPKARYWLYWEWSKRDDSECVGGGYRHMTAWGGDLQIYNTNTGQGMRYHPLHCI